MKKRNPPRYRDGEPLFDSRRLLNGIKFRALPALDYGLLSFALGRALVPEITGVVTNDSVGYLRGSADIREWGLIAQGYRQVAYPVVLRLASTVGERASWDVIFSIALLQRFLLLLGIVLVWSALRLWSAPIILVASSATLVAHMDFLLPEGFLVPGCLLLSGLAASAATKRGLTVRYPSFAFALASFLVTAMSLIKLQYSSLILLLLGMSVLLWSDGLLSRRAGMVGIGAIILICSVFSLGQALENRRELGVFEPIAERARTEWYFAWYATFRIDSQNQHLEQLDEFWSDGDPWAFMHGIEETVPDYVERTKITRSRIDSMFGASGANQINEKLRSFWGALRGGRSDDLAGMIDLIRADNSESRRQRIDGNFYSKQEGVDQFLLQFSENRYPEHVRIGPLLFPTQMVLGDFRPLRPLLCLSSLLLTVLALFVDRRNRPIHASSLCIFVGISVVMASIYSDNGRYLLGPMLVILVSAMLAVRYFTTPLVRRGTS